jgi:hypothetical protein
MEKQIAVLRRGMRIASLIVLLVAQPRWALSDNYTRLYPILEQYVRDFRKQFRNIPEQRRHRLNEIVKYLEKCRTSGTTGRLFFIDTDQSALSHWAQVWAKTAAHYFRQEWVEIYSGALHPGDIAAETIFALERAGYIVYRSGVEGTAVYKIKYSYNLEPIMAFSKPLDFRKNPRKDFMAIILETNADLNLPRVPGTINRLALLFDEPAGYAASEEVEMVFDKTCRQVALEMFYVFWKLEQEE